MHYVWKVILKENRHIENKQIFLFIQIRLNGTSLKKGKKCLPNEHLNHEKSISWLFLSEIIILNNLGLLKKVGS